MNATFQGQVLSCRYARSVSDGCSRKACSHATVTPSGLAERMRCPPKENIAQRSVKSISRCVLLLSRGFVLHCPTEACWWRVLFSPRRPATCALTSAIKAWGTILRLLFLPWDHRDQHGRGNPPIFFLIFVGPYLKKNETTSKNKTSAQAF